MDYLIKYILVVNLILWYFVEIEVSYYSHSWIEINVLLLKKKNLEDINIEIT
jgi:hypothetical protein